MIINVIQQLFHSAALVCFGKQAHLMANANTFCHLSDCYIPVIVSLTHSSTVPHLSAICPQMIPPDEEIKAVGGLLSDIN